MSIESHREHLRRQPDSYFRADDPSGIAVLWEAGAPRNQERAALACLKDAERHHYRFEDTPAGRYVTTQDLSAEDRKLLRDEGQLRMAQAARGPVEVYAMEAASDSHFRQKVMPALLANEHVPLINDASRGRLAQGNRDAQFEAVCASELFRDHRRVPCLLPDPARPGSLYHGDVHKPPQPTPCAPAEADPNLTSPLRLKKFYELMADARQRERDERQKDRQQPDRERDGR